MLIKVNTDIFINVEGEQQAEQASLTLEQMLSPQQFIDFQNGHVLSSRINHWSEATTDEVERVTGLH